VNKYVNHVYTRLNELAETLGLPPTASFIGVRTQDTGKRQILVRSELPRPDHLPKGQPWNKYETITADCPDESTYETFITLGIPEMSNVAAEEQVKVA
jgi:hypothetical protein